MMFIVIWKFGLDEFIELIKGRVIKFRLPFQVFITLDHLNILDQKWRLFHVAYVMLGVFFHYQYLRLILTDFCFKLSNLLSKGSDFLLMLDFHHLHFFFVKLLHLSGF